jgi:hypothetical protein|tara:strand:+ start:11188 stop:11754 length:567 start_codon:yes stop_codon:yes gene_type:complete
MRPQGFVTISKLTRPDGREISTQEAVDKGLIKALAKKPSGWGIQKHEIPLGHNLFTDEGRQTMAYAFGFRSPIVNYVCTQFGIGTGTTPPKVTDVTLESPLTFYDSDSSGTPDSQYKPISKASFPYPFIVDIELPLAYSEANTQLITELGLFTGSSGGGGNTLLARKVILGYNKDSSLAPTFVWRLRF